MRRPMTGTRLSLAFDGKRAIHPGQIETIDREFSPGKEEIAVARDMLVAADEVERVAEHSLSGVE